MKRIILIPIGLLLVVLCGCSKDNSGVARGKRSAWRAALMADRAKNDVEFKEDLLSPMAGTNRLTLRGDGPHGLTISVDGVTQTDAADALCRLEKGPEGSWTAVVAGSEPVSVQSGAPVKINNRYTVSLYPGDTGLVALVFDNQRPELQHFGGLHYFEPDPAYAVNAVVERLDQPEQLQLTTSRDEVKTYWRVARLHFQLNGVEQTLAAYKMGLDGPYSDMFFVPFRDATSGDATYGAGRFLELQEPDGSELLLDFNRAFNPLCNYSPAYNCPLPPPENHLLVPIEAGEQTYPH